MSSEPVQEVDVESARAGSAVVQVFAIDEPALLEGTLDAVADQRAPDDVDVALEAWITPLEEDPDADATFSIAADHEVARARVAPGGKLSARNRAHDDAVERGADVIVTWDADVRPAAPDVLAALVGPIFRHVHVVATNSRPRYRLANPVGAAATAIALVEDLARPHLHGQASAFSRFAWAECGPFDESVDQLDARQVRREEEFRFFKRVDAFGNVAQHPDAVVIEQRARRPVHQVNRAFDRFGGYHLGEWGAKRGTVGFQPHSRSPPADGNNNSDGRDGDE